MAVSGRVIFHQAAANASELEHASRTQVFGPGCRLDCGCLSPSSSLLLQRCNVLRPVHATGRTRQEAAPQFRSPNTFTHPHSETQSLSTGTLSSTAVVPEAQQTHPHMTFHL